jgi:hypothetical protein
MVTVTDKAKKEGLEKEPLKIDSNGLNAKEDRNDDMTSPIWAKPLYKNCYKNIWSFPDWQL